MRPPDEREETAEEGETKSEPVLPAQRSDLIDAEFNPEMPIEEPVTSGGDTNQWVDPDEEEDDDGTRQPNRER